MQNGTVRQLGMASRVICPLSMGFFIGAAISLWTSPPDAFCAQEAVIDESATLASPQLLLIRKVAQYLSNEPFEAVIKASSPAQNFELDRKPVRPRFLASEVNQRDKLYVMVLTSSESLAHSAAYLNQTVSHHVSKAAFVINRDDNRGLMSDELDHMIVHRTGLSTQPAARLLHIIEFAKHQSTLDNYDWTFFMPDTTYLKAFKLREMVTHMPLGQQVFMGAPVPPEGYCLLDAGILMSHELVKTVADNVEVCLSRVDHTMSAEQNLAACIRHITGVTCRSEWNNKSFRTWRNTDDVDLEARVNGGKGPGIARQDLFNWAMTVWPVAAHHQHLLNAHYCQLEIDNLSTSSVHLQSEIQSLQPADEPLIWPIGIKPAQPPKTRYEAHKWQTFTKETLFANRPDTNEVPLLGVDRRDVDEMVDRARTHLRAKGLVPSDHTLDLNLGYRLFDPTRGMEYIIDLIDLTTHRIHRVRAIRPLNRAEQINEYPYMREDANVTVIIPISRDDAAHVRAFTHRYVTLTCGSDQSGVSYLSTVTLIFTPYGLHEPLAISQIKKDVRAELADGNCPPPRYDFKVHDATAVDTTLDAISSVARTRPPTGIYLVVDVWTQMHVDFINRVRLNTVPGLQIFAPIPFYQFDKRVSADQSTSSNSRVLSDLLARHDYLMPVLSPNDVNEMSVKIDVHKDYGRFDPLARNVVAVAARDLVQVLDEREALKLSAVDRDDLVSLFVGHQNLHLLRAPDPHLIVHYHLLNCAQYQQHAEAFGRCQLRRRHGLASKGQIAKLIFQQQESQ